MACVGVRLVGSADDIVRIVAVLDAGPRVKVTGTSRAYPARGNTGQRPHLPDR